MACFSYLIAYPNNFHQFDHHIVGELDCCIKWSKQFFHKVIVEELS